MGGAVAVLFPRSLNLVLPAKKLLHKRFFRSTRFLHLFEIFTLDVNNK